MNEPDLQGLRILVAEDNWLIADEIVLAMTRHGAKVVGPVGRVSDALAMISGAERLDGGVLDIDLRGESVYPAAAALDRRGARYVFLTGYDGLMVPGAYRHVARFEKPVDPARLVSAFVAAGAERPLA